ncbi:MAG: hypothetical protein IT204_17255 [Fimbriimonadaceae bacterium]|nr:hypothetical protein [Fimbriimonadaceae bacterium]
MRRSDPLLQQIATAGRLGWRARRRLGAGPDEALVDALLARLQREPAGARRGPRDTALAWLQEYLWWYGRQAFRSATRAAVLASELAREGLPAGAASSSTARLPHLRGLRLRRLEELLAPGAGEVVPQLVSLLRGPAGGGGTTLTPLAARTGDPWRDWIYTGPKIVALRLLSPEVLANRVPLLEELLRNGDSWTALAAGVALHQVQGAAAAPLVVTECLRRSAPGSAAGGPYLRALAALGADLVPPAVSWLADSDETRGAQAVALLWQLGHPAVPATAACYEACPGPPRQRAAQVLAALDPAWLRRLQTAPDPAERGLSLARDSADPALGLSRSEP